MSVIFMDCLREAMYRKVFPLMVGLALLFAAFEVHNVEFETGKNGEAMARHHGYKKPMAAGDIVAMELDLLAAFSSGPAIFFSIFLVAPLLTTYLEKGAIELAFTKGVSRKHIYLAKLAGAFLVYSIPIFLFNALPVFYFAWHTDLNWARFLDSIFLQMLAFLGIFIVMAAAALSQRGQATVVVTGYAFFMVSALMESRHAMGLGETFGQRFMMNWMTVAWVILPKPQELMAASVHFLNDEFTSWFALA